jgi:hypothetical protein
MVSVRQTLDRSSRNAISDSNDLHRHHAQTIRRPSAATSGATARRGSMLGSGGCLATQLPSSALPKGRPPTVWFSPTER